MVITDKETEISENEFYGCSNLKSISLGNRVETIGNFAFSGCSALEDFSFGYSLKTIGDEAFSDCTALTQLTSHALIPPTCGNQALDDINKWNCQLIVPEQSLDDYKSAPQWKEFFFIDGEDFGGAIIIDFDEITIKKGETFTLTANVYIDNSESSAISWSSSDTNVATVSEDGLVTGVSVGTATITASCGGISATCEVTVTEVVAESIILNEEEISLIENESFQLTATIVPENTTDQTVLWSSSDNKVATVSEDGLVTGISAGTATITASYGEVSATCEVIVTEEDGVEDVLMDSDSLISVYSLQGFLVKDKCSTDDLKKLPKGIYIIVTANKSYKINI